MAKKQTTNPLAIVASVTLAFVARTWGDRRKRIAEMRENIRDYALAAYRIVKDGAFRLELVNATGKARLVDKRSGKTKEIPSMNEVDVLCFDGTGVGQGAIIREIQRLAPAIGCEVDKGFSIVDLFQKPHNGKYLTPSQLGTIGKRAKSRKDAEKLADSMTKAKPRGAKSKGANKPETPWQVIRRDFSEARKTLPKLTVQQLAKLTDEVNDFMEAVNKYRPAAKDAPASDAEMGAAAS